MDEFIEHGTDGYGLACCCVGRENFGFCGGSYHIVEDFAYDVYQYDTFSHKPNLSRELARKHIARYLRGARTIEIGIYHNIK